MREQPDDLRERLVDSVRRYSLALGQNLTLLMLSNSSWVHRLPVASTLEFQLPLPLKAAQGQGGAKCATLITLLWHWDSSLLRVMPARKARRDFACLMGIPKKDELYFSNSSAMSATVWRRNAPCPNVVFGDGGPLWRGSEHTDRWGPGHLDHQSFSSIGAGLSKRADCEGWSITHDQLQRRDDC